MAGEESETRERLVRLETQMIEMRGDVTGLKKGRRRDAAMIERVRRWQSWALGAGFVALLTLNLFGDKLFVR